MALIDADGFDHYGAPLTGANTNTVLSAAGYSTINATLENNINGVTPPTGLAYLYHSSIASTIARPVASGAVNQSQQVKLNFSGGVIGGGDIWGIAFCDVGLNVIVKAMPRANGTWVLLKDNNVNNALVTTEAGIIRANTWQTWEFVYKPNTGAGTVPSPYNGVLELWLEGVLKARATGLNVSAAPSFHFMGPNAIVGAPMGVCIKDWISNDASGTYLNATPLGPRRTSTRFVNGNGAVNNWVATGAASQWNCVAKTSPSIVSFIDGANPGDVQEFTLPASLNTIAGVSGLVVKAYAQKLGAGVGTFKIGVLSSGSVINSAEITPGTSPVFWGSGGIGFDPATGAPFTSAAFNAIGLRITRVQ